MAYAMLWEGTTVRHLTMGRAGPRLCSADGSVGDGFFLECCFHWMLGAIVSNVDVGVVLRRGCGVRVLGRFFLLDLGLIVFGC